MRDGSGLAYPALRRCTLSSDGDLLVFARHDDASGDMTVVAVNRGDSTAALDVRLPNAWAALRVVRAGRLTAERHGRQAPFSSPSSSSDDAKTLRRIR
jgi:hypothetical protein